MSLVKFKDREGFSLIELIVVITIVSVLAAIAVPQLASYRLKAKLAAVTSDFRNIETAVEAYYTDYTSYPVDVNSGVTPLGLEEILNSGVFTTDTPIGGRYDYNAPPNWTEISLRVVNSTDLPFSDTSGWLRYDGTIDNGSLNSGKFQTIGDGHAYIVNENP